MSLFGISLGVCVIVTVMSVMNGFQIEIKERMLNFTPHATIRTAQSSQPKQAFIDVFENDPDIQYYSAFSEDSVLILNDELLNPIRLIAYENQEYLAEEKLKTVLIDQSEQLLDEPFSIVIGNDLAEEISVGIGDKLRLLTNEKLILPFGSLPRMKDFTVTGIFDSGIFEIDESIALIGMKDANTFLQLENNITGYVFDFIDPSSSQQKIKEIAKTINVKGWISDWSSENPNFFRSLDLTRQIIFLVLMSILTIACFNIVSTQSMLISEKRSSIASLIAVGFGKKNIFYLFITLGTCFGLIGLVIGVSLSVVLSENLSHIVGFVEQITSVRLYQQEIYFLAEIPSVIDWRETFKISILTLILSVFSSLVPAYNATKTDPAILMKNVRFK
ncbi:MAG TPA: ABC transporter permease [Gammaproteobacteria bacterium]|jgi:lipoprotein-releasing system permease protein|nr:ABC transporter permease [Gammaproteobacteria bacterium]|tara:strand:+ start:6289 stop:7455 length:1167 start_codon:yes stop_codon:yes gene_type:complete